MSSEWRPYDPCRDSTAAMAEAQHSKFEANRRRALEWQVAADPRARRLVSVTETAIDIDCAGCDFWWDPFGSPRFHRRSWCPLHGDRPLRLDP